MGTPLRTPHCVPAVVSVHFLLGPVVPTTSLPAFASDAFCSCERKSSSCHGPFGFSSSWALEVYILLGPLGFYLGWRVANCNRVSAQYLECVVCCFGRRGCGCGGGCGCGHECEATFRGTVITKAPRRRARRLSSHEMKATLLFLRGVL